MTLQLQEFGTGVGWFKGGLYGDAGSGKSWTATLLALYIKKLFSLPGRIFYFDTETGAEFVDKKLVFPATGQHLKGVRSRTLGDAIDFIAAAETEKAAVVIFDSVTHINEEIDRSFLLQLNEELARKGKQKRKKIEWQDRGQLNAVKARFTDAYLNARTHIILCGRSANIWEMTVNPETEKQELNKIGTKMKTDANLAYEPSFLAEMVRENVYVDGVQQIVRTMTVLKDRFSVMDGKQFQNPSGESFLPHLQLLTPGAVNEVDTTKQTPMDVSEEGDTAWAQERLNRQIACERIQALFVKMIPGRGAAEQKAKAIALEQVYGTPSWTHIETKIPANKLVEGLKVLEEVAIPAAVEQINADEVKDKKPAKAEKVTVQK